MRKTSEFKDRNSRVKEDLKNLRRRRATQKTQRARDKPDPKKLTRPNEEKRTSSKDKYTQHFSTFTHANCNYSSRPKKKDHPGSIRHAEKLKIQMNWYAKYIEGSTKPYPLFSSSPAKKPIPYPRSSKRPSQLPPKRNYNRNRPFKRTRPLRRQNARRNTSTLVHPTDIPVVPPHNINGKILHQDHVVTSGEWKREASFHGLRAKPDRISAKKPYKHFNTRKRKEYIEASYKVGKYTVDQLQRSRQKNEANRLAKNTMATIPGAHEAHIKRQAWFRKQALQSQDKARQQALQRDEKAKQNNKPKRKKRRRGPSPHTVRQMALEESATAIYGTRHERLKSRRLRKITSPIQNTKDTAIDLTTSDQRQKASEFQEREAFLEQLEYSEENFAIDGGILPAEASPPTIDIDAAVGKTIPPTQGTEVIEPTLVSTFFRCFSYLSY